MIKNKMEFLISTIKQTTINVIGEVIEIVEVEEITELGEIELTFVGENGYFVVLVDNKGLYLLEIEVVPQKQNNGIATKIIKNLLEVAKNNGFKRYGVLGIHNNKIWIICDKLGILEKENGSDRMVYFN